MFTFNQFDFLAFFTGTGTLTVAGGGLVNSAVLVALIVLLTKLVEWRIKVAASRKQKAAEDEMKNAKTELAAALKENNRLLRKLAGEEATQQAVDYVPAERHSGH